MPRTILVALREVQYKCYEYVAEDVGVCFKCGGGIKYVHRSPVSRKAADTDPSARGYIWATLFLGDINTGTWPSRLRESQELGQ
jgi:hypothetical protein